jgi:hypothetical protein
MDIPKHQFSIKPLIFLRVNSHAKMAPDTLGLGDDDAELVNEVQDDWNASSRAERERRSGHN